MCVHTVTSITTFGVSSCVQKKMSVRSAWHHMNKSRSRRVWSGISSTCHATSPVADHFTPRTTAIQPVRLLVDYGEVGGMCKLIISWAKRTRGLIYTHFLYRHSGTFLFLARSRLREGMEWRTVKDDWSHPFARPRQWRSWEWEEGGRSPRHRFPRECLGSP